MTTLRLLISAVQSSLKLESQYRFGADIFETFEGWWMFLRLTIYICTANVHKTSWQECDQYSINNRRRVCNTQYEERRGIFWFLDSLNEDCKVTMRSVVTTLSIAKEIKLLLKMMYTFWFNWICQYCQLIIVENPSSWNNYKI